jgi:carbon storage regulator
MALKLIRRKGEGLQIGLDIRVMVLEIRRDTVRLSVEAPCEMPVHRGEVFDAIQIAGSRLPPQKTEKQGDN